MQSIPSKLRGADGPGSTPGNRLPRHVESVGLPGPGVQTSARTNTIMQTRPHKEKISIGQKQLALRNKLWPSIKDDKLWLRKTKTGFTTVPRTMPLIMEIMDAMSKGKPVSTTYLELWCRAFDECFVTLNKPREMAF